MRFPAVVSDDDMKLNANRIKAIAQDSPTAQLTTETHGRVLHCVL